VYFAQGRLMLKLFHQNYSLCMLFENKHLNAYLQMAHFLFDAENLPHLANFVECNI